MQSKSLFVWHALGAIVASGLTCWHFLLVAAQSEPIRTDLARQTIMVALITTAVAWVVAQFALSKKADWIAPIAGGIGGLAGAVVLNQAVGGTNLALSMALGTVVAVAAHFVVQEKESAQTPALMLVATWVAVGAVAFSLARTTGMAAALLAGCLVAGLGNNSRALGALGGLFALIAVRGLEGGATQARLSLDLSHHHALLGLILMVVAIDAFCSYLGDLSDTSRTVLASLLGIALCVSLAVLLPVLTGPRAVTGVLLGSGLGIALAGARQSAAGKAWVGGGVAVGSLLVLLPQLNDSIDLTRDQKMVWLYTGAAVVTALLIGLVILAKQPARQEVVREA